MLDRIRFLKSIDLRWKIVQNYHRQQVLCFYQDLTVTAFTHALMKIAGF